MEAYIIVYIIILFSGIIYEGNKNHKNAKKIYCIFVTIVLLTLIGLRDETLGNSDTVAFYIPRFKLINTMSFERTYEYFLNTDPVFYTCTKFITLFTNNVNLYLFICSLPLVIGFSRLIYKHCEIPVIGYFVFLGLGYYFTAFITLRNSVALGILLFSYDYIVERKFWRYLLVIMIAALFHISVLFFLPAYFLTKLKFKLDWKWISIFCIFVIMVVFKNMAINIFFKFIKNDHLILYQDRNVQLNMTLFFEYLLIFGFCLYFKKYNYINNYEENNILYILTYIGTLIAMLVVLQDVMFRVSAFYSIYLSILIPNCVKCDRNPKSRMLMSAIIILLLAIWGIKFSNDLNLIPYKTFF